MRIGVHHANGSAWEPVSDRGRASVTAASARISACVSGRAGSAGAVRFGGALLLLSSLLLSLSLRICFTLARDDFRSPQSLSTRAPPPSLHSRPSGENTEGRGSIRANVGVEFKGVSWS